MNRTLAACLSLILLSSGATHAQWFRPGPRTQPFMPSPDRGESFLGVYLADVTPDLAELLSLPEERGAHVNQVISDSPAAEAGLEADDVILGWNDMPVESARQFTRMVRETPPGREVRLQVFRRGESVELSARIGAQPMFSPPPMRERPGTEDEPWCPALPPREFFQWPESFGSPQIRRDQPPRLGVIMQPLTDQLAAYFGLEGRSGALVSSVMEGSAAEAEGVRAGDVILSVDGNDVSSPGAVQQAIAQAGTSAFELGLMREREEVTLTIPAIDDEEEGDDEEETTEVEETYPIDSL